MLKRKIQSILFCAASLCASVSYASDKALLDLLVANDNLSSDDAQALIKDLVDVPAPSHSGKIEKLRIYGMIQTQYQYANAMENAAGGYSRTSNGFQLRRLFLGVYANLAHDMMAVVDLNVCAEPFEYASFLNMAFISKAVENEYLDGTVYLGYKKTNFSIEEYAPASTLLSVDRSMVTRYFTIYQRKGSGNVGLGSAYTGIFWNGKSRLLKGLGYGFAVTNSQNYAISQHTPDDFGKGINFWADVYYDGKFELDASDFEYRFGTNAVYGSNANSHLHASGNADSYGEIWGVNPYVKLKWNHFTFWSELVMSGIQHGRALGTQSATPFGVNVWLEKTFDCGEWGRAGPILRYSYLNTDGRGARVSDCFAGVANVDTSGDSAVNLYDTAQSISAGVNWYLYGNNLKIQAAYEWAQFNGSVSHSSVSSKSVDANIFRIQVQVVF